MSREVKIKADIDPSKWGIQVAPGCGIENGARLVPLVGIRINGDADGVCYLDVNGAKRFCKQVYECCAESEELAETVRAGIQ